MFSSQHPEGVVDLGQQQQHHQRIILPETMNSKLHRQVIGMEALQMANTKYIIQHTLFFGRYN